MLSLETCDFLKRCHDRWWEATDARRAWGLGIFSALMFLVVNWRGYHQDVVPLAFTPVSIVRHGTVNLDAFQRYHDLLPLKERWAWTESNGHLYSRKSMFVSMLVAPWYIPPVVAGVPTDTPWSCDFWISWGRMAAAGLTGLTVAIVYLTLRRRGSIAAATSFAFLFAFGTCVWTIIGQTLYDHEAILFVAIAAWLLRDFPLQPRRAFAAALAVGTAVVLRPTCVVLLFPLGLYMLTPGQLAGRRSYLAAFAGILLLPLMMAVANHICFGAWYSTGYPPDEYRDSWRAFWPAGAVGLLVAPNSGLLIQSPFLLLAFVGAARVWSRDAKSVQDPGLLRCYSLCIVAYWVLMAKWHDWQGGLTFTSRMISEGYPLWMILVMEGWNRLRDRPWALPATAAAGAWSVAYELVNLATFDRTTPLNTLHEPWTPWDHFFWVHVSHPTLGPWQTVLLVSRAVTLFIIVGIVVIYALRGFILPPRSPKVAEGVQTPVEVA
jgi:hypothetical protein